jgi:hypothetical protein
MKWRAAHNEHTRFSYNVHQYITAISAYIVRKCIVHAAKQVVGTASMISSAHLCAGQVTSLGIYPLIAHLPSFKTMYEEQTREAQRILIRDAATRTAKEVKRKYSRAPAKDGTRPTVETVTAVVDEVLGHSDEVEQQPEAAQNAAQDPAQAVKGHDLFLSGVSTQCSADLSRSFTTPTFRITMVLKKTLSAIVKEFVYMITTDILNVLHLTKSKTADADILYTVVLNRMCSGHEIVRQYTYEDSTETDPNAHAEEQKARKEARDAKVQRANVTDKDLPKRACKVVVRTDILPEQFQQLWAFVQNAVDTMKAEAEVKKQKNLEKKENADGIVADDNNNPDDDADDVDDDDADDADGVDDDDDNVDDDNVDDDIADADVDADDTIEA